jgi:hypothetical protein
MFLSLSVFIPFLIYLLLSLFFLGAYLFALVTVVLGMAAYGIDPFLKGNVGRNTRGLLRIIILGTIAAAAISSRLFSVIRKYLNCPPSRAVANRDIGFESIIHECTYRRFGYRNIIGLL